MCLSKWKPERKYSLRKWHDSEALTQPEKQLDCWKMFIFHKLVAWVITATCSRIDYLKCSHSWATEFQSSSSLCTLFEIV